MKWQYMLLTSLPPLLECLHARPCLQEEPATSQLYVLCDMALAMLRALAQRMGLEPGLLTAKHPGGITLPASFYRPLDKEERGERSVLSAEVAGCTMLVAPLGIANMLPLRNLLFIT